MIFIKLILIIYGALNIWAGILKFKNENLDKFYLLFCFGGTLLLVTAFQFNIYLLMLGLLFLLVIGGINGSKQNTFHLSHLLIKLALSIIIIMYSIILS